jgi:predicted negative regulator of RcsB-dependent stress response
MQTQDAPAEIIFKLWPWLEANKTRLIGAGAAVVVVAGIFYFISSQKEQREIAAGQALSLLMVNPPGNAGSSQMAEAFEQIAAKYAGTAAGLRAQLQAGAALFNAGSYADAQAQFQKYLDAGVTGPLAATAQLGVAASLEAQNKLDLAVPAYQKVTSVYAGTASVLPAEFALGRITEQQNKLTEALSHYENAARSAQGSALAQEAAMRASALKAKTAAAAPKPAAAPMAITNTNTAP